MSHPNFKGFCSPSKKFKSNCNESFNDSKDFKKPNTSSQCCFRNLSRDLSEYSPIKCNKLDSREKVKDDKPVSQYDSLMENDIFYDEDEILEIEASQRSPMSGFESFMNDQSSFDDDEILSIVKSAEECNPQRSEYDLFMDDQATFDENEILSLESILAESSPKSEVSELMIVENKTNGEYESFMNDQTIFDENEILSIETNDEENQKSQEYKAFMNDQTIFDENEILSIETNGETSEKSQEYEAFMNDKTTFDENEIVSIETNDEANQKSQEYKAFMNDQTIFDKKEILSIETNCETSEKSQEYKAFLNDQTIINENKILKSQKPQSPKCKSFMNNETPFDENKILSIETKSELSKKSEEYESFLNDQTTFDEVELQFQERKGRMNKGQRELFDFVADQIDKEHRNEKCPPINLFVTGSAGTGKSYVLNLIVEQINKTCGSAAVKVCAFTGAAAILVNGQTIHSTFRLNVIDPRVHPKNRKPEFKDLSDQNISEWRPVRFLIIDEVSMVSYEYLSKINMRLQELKHKRGLFGEVNVLLFGDLFQLPPINGNPVFQQPDKYTKYAHLFRLFKLCELTEIERQRGNTEFIDLLNNLRVCKLTDDQYSLLEKKLKKSDEIDDKVLRIVPRCKMADDHNEMISQKTNKPKMIITAIDEWIKMREGKKLRHTLEEATPKSTSFTYGIPKTLEIYEGLRVMLRLNLNVNTGLVNGSLGEIVTIQIVPDSELPKILVNFDKNGLHWILPEKVEFEANFDYGTIRRTMIPFIPAYAITVHKLQGCTVEKAAIDLGTLYFAPGQKFVALSRVSSLEGIIITSIDKDRLVKGEIVDQRCLEEMDRLRSLPKFNE